LKASIFGAGYVGVVSAACLARRGHSIVVVDVNPAKVQMINAGASPIVEEGVAELVDAMVRQGRLRATTLAEEAIAETELSLVSVGTPSASNGSLSTIAVDKVSGEIGHAIRGKNAEHTVIYRSTILPGTMNSLVVPRLVETSGRAVGEGLHVGFNPEFLREGSSVKDFETPPFTVVGSATERGYELMETLYAGLDAPFFRVSITLAESVKYLSNLFHALKITFANEAGTLLQALGIDSREAMQVFCEDRQLNISKAYLQPGYAFGGSCLPKDIRAFLFLAKSHDVSLPMLQQVLPSNNAHIERAFQMVESCNGRRIAMLGLSFKPGTDDMRESPLVALAERMIGRGYDMTIYDPNVETAKLMGANREFIENEIPHLSRLLERDLEKAVADVEVIVVGHLDRIAVAKLMALEPTAAIVDLQGVAELQARKNGKYLGICW
jgi:GDP-mannose 6-dehydrogenase